MEEALIQSLRFENLSFSYETDPPILDDVTFDFPMDQLVWLKAKPGEGRSSLLHLMANLCNPTDGDVFVNDLNATEMSFQEFLQFRLKIGYSFDLGGLINNRTLIDNLTLPLNYHNLISPKEAKERASYYLEKFNILKYKDVRPAMVSGGFRFTVCVIRAFIMHPEVLLFDDPAVGLGQEQSVTFVNVIKDLMDQGIAKHVFISTFDERLMANFSYSTVLLTASKLKFEAASPIHNKKVPA